MELDATRKRPRFNISREEFQRRLREQLCLKCATTWTLSQELPEKRLTEPIQPTSQELATREENRPLANQTKD